MPSGSEKIAIFPPMGSSVRGMAVLPDGYARPNPSTCVIALDRRAHSLASFASLLRPARLNAYTLARRLLLVVCQVAVSQPCCSSLCSSG